MKKICNMNFDDMKAGFASFSKKHSISDDFDLNYNVINSIKPLLTDNEAITDCFYDVFRFGFMAGYMQNEKELKKQIENKLNKEMHRDLVELAYNLPFGFMSTYFYPFMVFSLEHEGVLCCLPRKVQNKARAFITKYNEEAAQKEQEEQEQKQPLTEEERKKKDLQFAIMDTTLKLCQSESGNQIAFLEQLKDIIDTAKHEIETGTQN